MMDDRLVEYEFLTIDERDAVHGWLRDHGIDPKRTPLDAVIESDPVTCEWRIEQLWVDANGKHRLNEKGDDVRRVIVRRRAQRPLPWPTWEEKLGRSWGPL